MGENEYFRKVWKTKVSVRVSSYIALKNGTSYICNKYTDEANKLEYINMQVSSNPEWKKHFEIFQSFRGLSFAILILVQYQYTHSGRKRNGLEIGRNVNMGKMTWP